jgi:hypothetical protein
MPLRENYTLPNKNELSDAYKAFIATMQQHMQQQQMQQPQQQPQGFQSLIEMLMNRGAK